MDEDVMGLGHHLGRGVDSSLDEFDFKENVNIGIRRILLLQNRPSFDFYNSCLLFTGLRNA